MKQLFVPLLSFDVSPGVAAVPEAELGIKNEGAFWQKDMYRCTWERRGKEAKLSVGLMRIWRFPPT